MSLKFIPLGGLGEFGLNTLVVETESQRLLIDCGVMFPDPTVGVDYIIPDFSYLLEDPSKLSAILITHGHEDHIGGIPYLLKQCPAPIYGTPFTLALLKKRFLDMDIPLPKMHEISPPAQFEIGDLKIEYLPVSHSIPDACSIVLHSEEGIVIYTGDYKIDSHSEKQALTLKRLKELGEKGVRLLFSDSTNSELPGSAPSESTLIKPLEEIFSQAKGRIFVALFSTHIQRLQLFLDLANQFGRRVALTGRSLLENASIAEKLGYLRWPPGLEIPLDDIDSLNDDEIVVLATGTQGERGSALPRMAIKEHSGVSIHPGDLLIHSARLIPGNEIAIGHMFDGFYRQGARVIHAGNVPVHVSGHAQQEDQKQLIKILKPEFFVPIHGEYRFLAKHAQLAQDVGLKPERTIIMENGDLLELSSSGLKHSEFLKIERVFVEGAGYDDISGALIRTRRQLARTGVVIVVILREGEKGPIVTGPHIICKGVTESEELIEEIRRTAASALMNPTPEFTDPHEEVRVVIRRLLEKHLSKRPLVVPLILEI